MAEKIRVMIPEEEVDAKIAELGKQISEEYAGESVHLLCILKGSVFFTCELAKRITVPVSLDFMSVSSYGDGPKSSGIVKIAERISGIMNPTTAPYLPPQISPQRKTGICIGRSILPI